MATATPAWGGRSLISDLTFSWAGPALRLGREHPLEEEDLSGFPVSEGAEETCSQLLEELHRQRGLTDDESAATKRALWARHRRALATTGCLRLVNTLVQAGPPVLLAGLLRTLEASAAAGTAAAGAASGSRSAEQHLKALRIIGLLATALTTKTLVESQYFFKSFILGNKIKVQQNKAKPILEFCELTPVGPSAHAPKSCVGDSRWGFGEPFSTKRSA